MTDSILQQIFKQIEMESKFQEVGYNRGWDDRNFQLEGEILRVDYQYGLIIKELKQKYRHIADELSNNVKAIKQLMKQNEKLSADLNYQCKQNRNLINQINEANNKLMYQRQNINGLKQENQQLRGEIKYLLTNQNKYQLKAQQFGKKKAQYKQQSIQMQQQIHTLSKQLKKIYSQNNQLQQLLQQEVLSTQNRIQTITFDLINRNTMEQAEKLVEKKCQSLNSYSSTVLKMRSQQTINEWQCDMKKLKNCIDYGKQYIGMLDPMNLDRIQSRQIFKFLKKCIKQKDEIQNQLSNLKESNKKTTEQLKNKLILFQEEIFTIKSHKNKVVTIDTQIQTQTRNSNVTQKNIIHLTEINTKLKIRISTLIECIEILALRSVALNHQLNNSHASATYYKTAARNSPSSPLTPKSRLRKVFYSVLFVEFLKKKRQWRVKVVNELDIRQRIEIQTMKLDKQGIKNVEIQKVKQITISSRKQLYSRTSQMISYYEFKLKNRLKEQYTKNMLNIFNKV